MYRSSFPFAQPQSHPVASFSPLSITSYNTPSLLLLLPLLPPSSRCPYIPGTLQPGLLLLFCFFQLLKLFLNLISLTLIFHPFSDYSDLLPPTFTPPPNLRQSSLSKLERLGVLPPPQPSRRPDSSSSASLTTPRADTFPPTASYHPSPARSVARSTSSP